ncbi:hypothetical protein GCM10011368_07420 [Hyunsoonleella pacifica]|uniref:hypothetical protein n=1 Tax=Hyunsoonleella pacifica TaxID=1080224 RepID=UPI00157FB0E9|nr:hypothetical protein GCM10011368_07420 [Hyunsoonleella pacifica]
MTDKETVEHFKKNFKKETFYISKRRADVFFRLKQGEFITFADGKDRKIQFELRDISKKPPRKFKNIF